MATQKGNARIIDSEKLIADREYNTNSYVINTKKSKFNFEIQRL